jgi:hypothetical protein
MRWTGIFWAAWLCRAAAICGPDVEVHRELTAAGATEIADPTDFDRNIAPFLALRSRHRGDLFVHERYQDAVRRFGIEGHLKAMAEEYDGLAAGHPGDLLYQFLAARAHIGRGTPSAIEALSAIANEHPGFAPAHAALAGTFAIEAFRDSARETAERARFLSLCPAAAIPALDPPLPERHPVPGHVDTIRAAEAAIRANEWRLQRIRAFDWYSSEFKRESLRTMQSDYWRFWELEVHCFREQGQPDKANAVLADMRRRAATMPDPDRKAQVERLSLEEPVRTDTAAVPRN